ncbi:tripartite tricarboxylate transporter substrate binding protein [Roseococcus sp. SDR]|uniref:Bug family tripartite tricarboxylate transporter substrate binding protein n=1 Tax=Roseococcus sp. SDR TaxID=2835532 RepID=UPI001BCABF91|nr:tripartite tricarboxylate transporter substrate binding protein [Roseococcus sp. SDR]MBS7788903.1 tripartite tricarboxylate transporter substrate binding protein [Roseococcus sp. SDR]MBV1844217.1 tripartite tricarboxylate transporter substrate binding protein [Roseococcus sp. SDR]
MQRRLLIATILAAPAIARAQTQPLRLIVPAPPGGSTDILARILVERASATLGQAVVVDNRGGAGGIIGTEAAARAAADGNTIILGHNQTHASNQWMARNLPYNVIESFSPVARLATVHHATVVPANSHARNMAGLIEMGRGGRRVSYASSQAGSASHVIAETFVRRSGMDAVHVPYRGGGPATQDTVAGVVDFYVSTWPGVVTLVREGRLRALSIGAAQRVPGFLDLPTTAEAGVPFMAVDAWFGLFAPRGVDAARVTRLSEAFLGALAQPETAERAAQAGLNAAPMGPADFAAFQLAEVRRWQEMATLTGIMME